MTKQSKNYNFRRTTPNASSKRECYSWGGHNIQGFRVFEEKALCLAS